MCRNSATADLIGEIRYSALDQTFFRFAPESGPPIAFWWYAPQFRVAWDGAAA